MKSLFRSLIYIVAFFFLPILAGVIGIISSMNLAMSSQGQPTYTLIDQIAPHIMIPLSQLWLY
ncbi:hypothetical protein [Caldalkalibacillus mannanilyticus]|uniref:hypothetical protein n=1 Tax=Caldalkalibacillus mannanilyticus TaxID=1418 RepID=UPI0006854E1F|nr:hypothetical protein [Caldalkalibacillus mannanilyticus]